MEAGAGAEEAGEEIRFLSAPVCHVRIEHIARYDSLSTI
jgi:hypothetical protein